MKRVTDAMRNLILETDREMKRRQGQPGFEEYFSPVCNTLQDTIVLFHDESVINFREFEELDDLMTDTIDITLKETTKTCKHKQDTT